jgi:hypothetical protein
MSHLPAFLFCLAGFAALAAAMDRPQRDIIGRALAAGTTRALQLAGACALLLALGILVAGFGWGLGLVMFSGHTSLAAGILHCALIAYARIRTRSHP